MYSISVIRPEKIKRKSYFHDEGVGKTDSIRFYSDFIYKIGITLWALYSLMYLRSFIL